MEEVARETVNRWRIGLRGHVTIVRLCRTLFCLVSVFSLYILLLDRRVSVHSDSPSLEWCR